MTNIFEIKGIVVITGAAGLMGKEHAKAVLQSGGSVALIDINYTELQKLKDEFQGNGFTGIHIFECDITNKNDVEKWINEHNSKNKLHNYIDPELETPYFFKNSLIGEQIFLVHPFRPRSRCITLLPLQQSRMVWQPQSHQNQTTFDNLEL